MIPRFLCLFLLASAEAGPFLPSVDDPRSPQLSHLDLRIERWATAADLRRGFIDIALPEFGETAWGTELDALGAASVTVATQFFSDTPEVVSLGDGGSITLRFSAPIVDRPGADIAVFENALSNTFLELAFVEASSDGVNFFRFPNWSFAPITSQIGSFDAMDGSNYAGLAGKFRAGFATPFDIAVLPNSPNLDKSAITHIRVIDVVGTINPSFASRDSAGQIINERYPTDFITGGFDLDAVGVVRHPDVLDTGDLLQDALGPHPTNPGIAAGLEIEKGENGTVVLRFRRFPWRTEFCYEVERLVSRQWMPFASSKNGGLVELASGVAGSVVEETLSFGQLVSILIPADGTGIFRIKISMTS